MADKDKKEKKEKKDKKEKDKKSSSSAPSSPATAAASPAPEPAATKVGPASATPTTEERGATAITKEAKSFIKNKDDNGLYKFVKCEETALHLKLEESKPWIVNFPADYPNTKERFSTSSTDETLAKFCRQVNEQAEKRSTTTPPVKLGVLLEKAADIYLDLFGEDEGEEDMDGGSEDYMAGIDDEEAQAPAKPRPKMSEHALKAQEIDTKKFLDIGSPAATLRLLTDLKNITKQDPKELGFTAVPFKDPKSGLENLYHWEVSLRDFDDKCALGKDIAKLKAKSGIDHVTLEMRFSKDYPHVPPFVRVVKPRFAFRTGHVTIGGSICMELLTTSGWSSINDIEFIIVQIRSEMVEGNAALDPQSFNNPNAGYTESEAWDAFYRAARGHGWKVDGLGPQMFPSMPNK